MQDFAKAHQWYKRLEKRAVKVLPSFYGVLVQVGLVLLYEYGSDEEQDYQKALERYKNLVDNNIGICFLRLGLMHYYGKGGSIAYKEIMDLFEKATRDCIIWDNKLTFVYHQTDLDKDATQSNLVFCTLNRSELIGESFYYLGMMYRNGQGVTQDEEKAQSHFRLAHDRGCKRAKFEIVN